MEEDHLLIQLVEKYGSKNWNLISENIEGRTGKQCRERWCNNLNPEINKSEWSLEEEMLLLLIHNKKGNKWSLMTKYLKGRNDNNIKNHWNSRMKKKIKFVEESLKNKKQEIKNRYKEYNDINVDKILINEFMEIISTQMKKINEDKIKNFELFKNIDLDNIKNDNKKKDKENNKVINLRKILGHRTHSQKRKRILKIKIKKKIKTPKKLIKFSKTETQEKTENDELKNNINNNIILPLSAFQCFNKEDNSSDKKVIISRKYTPIKIISSDINKDVNDISKKNLNLVFNDIKK